MNNKQSSDTYNRLSYQQRYDELNNYNKRESSKKKDVLLSRSIRWIIFIMFFITGVVVNLDHGTIPGATEEIQIDLNLDKTELGMFGSLVFLGNLIGALFSFTIINLVNRKILLICSLALNALCLYSFILTKWYWFLLLNRVIVGIFQVI
jgi:predicted MFS family arabinose efflux permease